MNKLITRLAVMFGEPVHSTDPAAYVKELERLMVGYSAAELDRAADVVIREHKPSHVKPWPTPAAICAALIASRTALTPRKIEDGLPKTWTRADVKTAYDLVRSEAGRDAADEGWCLSLWDFCRTNGRLPNAAETFQCKRYARDCDQSYASIPPDSGQSTIADGLNKALRSLGTTMLERRNRIARHAHGEIVDTSFEALEHKQRSPVIRNPAGEQ